MPFLAPLAVPLISMIGGSVAGKVLGGPSGAQKDANTALQQLALSTGQKGLSFLDNAQSTLAGPQSYFQNILSGNRGAVTSSLAPDISQINSGFNMAKQNAVELAPRSGGRSALFNELPFQKLGTVNNLFSTARNNAATAATSLGLGEGSIGAGAATGGSSGLANLLGQLGGQRAQQYGVGKDIGSSIYNIAKSIDWGNIFKGGGDAAP